MKIGVPGGLLFYKYEPFIRTFFNEIGVDTEYSTVSNKKILDIGTRNCIDEVCLPMKIFHGHAAKLQQNSDYIAVPRIMNCEFGESICPKFRGLPELVSSGTGMNKQIFTEPIYMDDRAKLNKALTKSCRKIGISDFKSDRAFHYAVENQKNTSLGFRETGYRKRVFLAGHPYNIYDSFANLNLIQKLHKLDIGVVTQEWISQNEKRQELNSLVKRPYWMFYIDNFAPAMIMMKRNEINGIIYVSSFCCGTDSIIIEMIKNRIGNLPMLVLKLDEQTGEAGYNTRLEAFREVLK